MVFGFFSNTRSAEEIQKLREESERILAKYPDRVIVFVNKLNKNKDGLPDIKNKKYVVPSTFTMGDFANLIRKNLEVGPTYALFYFVGNSQLSSMSSTMGEIYEKYKNPEDLRLYVTYDTENTFGEIV